MSQAKIDLIHDDWFGLAPLASPESLSEVSSISSRTSLVTAPAITPKILRRTPKIIGNLSTCADDIRNVRNFQLAKVFQSRGSPAATNSSSNLSFESATSNRVKLNTEYETDDFQSAEDILDNVLTSAGCKDYFSTSPGLLETHFDLLEEPKAFVPSPSTTPQVAHSDCIIAFLIVFFLGTGSRLDFELRHRSQFR